MPGPPNIDSSGTVSTGANNASSNQTPKAQHDNNDKSLYKNSKPITYKSKRGKKLPAQAPNTGAMRHGASHGLNIHGNIGADLDDNISSDIEQINFSDIDSPRAGMSPRGPNIDDLARRAKQGDVQAQYRLSKMYEKGNRIPKNPDEAMKFLKEAAENGHPAALNDLADVYYRKAESSAGQSPNGNGIQIDIDQKGKSNQDYHQYIKYKIYAADRGDPAALSDLRFNSVALEDVDKVMKCLTRAADRGDRTACGSLAYIYTGNSFCKKDFKLHMKYKLAYLNTAPNIRTDQEEYQKELEQALSAAKSENLAGKNTQAQAKIENDALHLLGNIQNQSERKAACAQLNFDLGSMYWEGVGVARNPQAAVEHFRTAADLGHADAQNQMGKLLYQGRIVQEDKPKAQEYFQNAVRQQHPEAMYHLAAMTIKVDASTKEQFNDAIDYLAQSALEGYLPARRALKMAFHPYDVAHNPNREAMRNKIGVCAKALYALKKLENLSPAELAQWHRLFAEAGDPAAQYLIAQAYKTGAGVKANDRQYVKWLAAAVAGAGKNELKEAKRELEKLKLSTRKEDNRKLFHLGNVYFYGDQVEKSPTDAIDCFQRAAQNGFAPAQTRMAVYHFTEAKKATDAFFEFKSEVDRMGFDVDETDSRLSAAEKQLAEKETALGKLGVQSDQTDNSTPANKGKPIQEKPSLDASEEEVIGLRENVTRLTNHLNEVWAQYQQQQERLDQFEKETLTIREKQRLEAVKYALAAAAQGDARGSYYLAEFEEEEGFRIESLRSDRRLLSVYKMADKHSVDQIFEQKRLDYLRVAADGGDPDAEYKIEGYLGCKNSNERLRYLHQAADQGVAEAQYTLARDYLYASNGAEKSLVTYIDYLTRAADQDHVDALEELAARFKQGYGVPKDMPRAIEYLEKAADLGSGGARFHLAHFYLNGSSITTDVDAAIELLDPIANGYFGGYFFSFGGLGKNAKEFGSFSKEDAIDTLATIALNCRNKARRLDKEDPERQKYEARYEATKKWIKLASNRRKGNRSSHRNMALRANRNSNRATNHSAATPPVGTYGHSKDLSTDVTPLSPRPQLGGDNSIIGPSITGFKPSWRRTRAAVPNGGKTLTSNDPFSSNLNRPQSGSGSDIRGGSLAHGDIITSNANNGQNDESISPQYFQSAMLGGSGGQRSQGPMTTYGDFSNIVDSRVKTSLLKEEYNDLVGPAESGVPEALLEKAIRDIVAEKSNGGNDYVEPIQTIILLAEGKHIDNQNNRKVAELAKRQCEIFKQQQDEEIVTAMQWVYADGVRAGGDYFNSLERNPDKASRYTVGQHRVGSIQSLFSDTSYLAVSDTENFGAYDSAQYYSGMHHKMSNASSTQADTIRRPMQGALPGALNGDANAGIPEALLEQALRQIDKIEVNMGGDYTAPARTLIRLAEEKLVNNDDPSISQRARQKIDQLRLQGNDDFARAMHTAYQGGIDVGMDERGIFARVADNAEKANFFADGRQMSTMDLKSLWNQD